MRTSKKLILIFILTSSHITFGQNSPCKITDISVDKKNGYVQWKALGDTNKRTFVVEQFNWNKWVKVNETEGANYQFGASTMPHTGENKIRISDGCAEGFISWTSEIKEIKFKIDRKRKKIKFSRFTLFEVFDKSGKLIDKGSAENLIYKNIPNGTYILNYDNTTAEIVL